MLLALFLSNESFGAGHPDSTSAANALEAEVKPAAASGAGFTGNVELRPGVYLGDKNALRSENQIQLGYKFSPDLEIFGRQELNTNISDANLASSKSGLDLTAGNLVFGLKLNNLYVNESAGLSFGYEPRVYLPTDQTNRANGMNATLRNYLKVKKSIASNVDVTFMEIPIFHFYNQAGKLDPVTGKTFVAPGYENRIYVIFDFAFLNNKLSVSMPFNLNTNFYRTFTAGNDPKSGSTQHKLWIYPEITYNVSPHIDLGVAFYSDALMASDLSKFTIGDGINKGVPQLVLRASL